MSFVDVAFAGYLAIAIARMVYLDRNGEMATMEESAFHGLAWPVSVALWAVRKGAGR